MLSLDHRQLLTYVLWRALYREKRIGPEAEPPGAAPHASATARRAPMVRAAAFSGHITPGYYKAPELDAEAFDKDGYFPRVCETSIRERLRPILRATGWPLRPAAY
jgi:hypothetical protein